MVRVADEADGPVRMRVQRLRMNSIPQSGWVTEALGQLPSERNLEQVPARNPPPPAAAAAALPLHDWSDAVCRSASTGRVVLRDWEQTRAGGG